MTSRPLQDSPSPITTVVFDYGEVLSVPPPESRFRLVALSGVPAEQFWDAYWHERRAYDAGLDSREYWDRLRPAQHLVGSRGPAGAVGHRHGRLAGART